MADTAQEQDEYTEIPSREDFQRWTEEYLHFSGKGISDYYPDMGSYLHDQLVRWRHGRRLRARQREGEREPDIVFDGEDFIWPCGCRWSIPGDGWEWCDDHPRGRYCLRNDHGE